MLRIELSFQLGVILYFLETCGNVWRQFWLSPFGKRGEMQLTSSNKESRDAAKLPTMHSSAPNNKELLS